MMGVLPALASPRPAVLGHQQHHYVPSPRSAPRKLPPMDAGLVAAIGQIPKQRDRAGASVLDAIADGAACALRQARGGLSSAVSPLPAAGTAPRPRRARRRAARPPPLQIPSVKSTASKSESEAPPQIAKERQGRTPAASLHGQSDPAACTGESDRSDSAAKHPTPKPTLVQGSEQTAQPAEQQEPQQEQQQQERRCAEMEQFVRTPTPVSLRYCMY